MDTKLNGYEPTPSEIKIVEVLSNPLNADKSITEICNLAGVSRKTYYSLMKKPEFVKYKNDVIMQFLEGKIGNVVNATYKYAVSSAKNSQDRKMLLTMAGLYADKMETTGETTVNNKVDLSGLSTEEIKKILEKE